MAAVGVAAAAAATAPVSAAPTAAAAADDVGLEEEGSAPVATEPEPPRQTWHPKASGARSPTTFLKGLSGNGEAGTERRRPWWGFRSVLIGEEDENTGREMTV